MGRGLEAAFPSRVRHTGGAITSQLGQSDPLNGVGGLGSTRPVSQEPSREHTRHHRHTELLFLGWHGPEAQAEDGAETEAEFMLDLIERFQDAAHSDDLDDRSPLAKQVLRLRARYEQLRDSERDDGVTFEQLGIDFVLVDEAHAFKALPLPLPHVARRRRRLRVLAFSKELAIGK